VVVDDLRDELDDMRIVGAVELVTTIGA